MAMRLPLTYAGCDYWDRTRALMDGSVRPAGLDLTYITGYPRDLFRRMAQYAEFDAAEMSMSTYIAMIASGDTRFIAIPVFPSRNFRHSYLFVSDRAGIATPPDLKGKRVGVPEYQMTAGLWIRGFLLHDYSIAAGDIRWFQGAMDEHGYDERYSLTLPAGISLTTLARGQALETMLAQGELDALIMAARPRLSDGEGVVRLFHDYVAVEQDYYRRTGLFPIMHTVVLRRDLYERHPWIATSLYEAFELAKRAGRDRIRVTGPLAVALPWLPAHLEEIERLFGGKDPWAYGIEANRRVLETMVGYAVEQGLAARTVRLDELFARETFVAPAIGRIA
ncbi:MAG: ABC transporter substrate-binding protein [Alphaproteobacteria bacterium]|nr:ABC transporter substrate-binding protein [Alphaproteobacteria bacterium]